MQIQVSGKQIDIGESLRASTEERLGSLAERYFRSAIDGSVTFSRAGNGYRADCAVHAGRGLNVFSHADGFDIHTALDAAMTRLEKRLRRYKRYLHERTQERTTDGAAANYTVLAGGEEAVEEVETLHPIVVAETATTIEAFSVGEAVMALELGNKATLMFRNAGHGGLNVVYRRPDGNIGWIDPKPDGVSRG